MTTQRYFILTCMKCNATFSVLQSIVERSGIFDYDELSSCGCCANPHIKIECASFLETVTGIVMESDVTRAILTRDELSSVSVRVPADTWSRTDFILPILPVLNITHSGISHAISYADAHEEAWKRNYEEYRPRGVGYFADYLVEELDDRLEDLVDKKILRFDVVLGED